jgi:hypothetical protein
MPAHLKGSALGQFKNDYGEGAKIVKGLFISPKFYWILIAYPDGTFGDKKKAKGIPKEKLTPELYHDLDAAGPGVQRQFVFEQLAATGMHPVHPQRALAHYNQEAKRSVRNAWNGARRMDDGTFRPWTDADLGAAE